MTGLLKTALPPVLFGVTMLVLWQVLTVAAGVPSFLLPPRPRSPRIHRQLRADRRGRHRHRNQCAHRLLVGGRLLGIAAAMLAVRFELVDGLLTPLAAGAAAVPIVALAPLLNSMYSTTTDLPRRLVVTIVVFFPVFVSTARGLRQVPRYRTT